VGDPARAALRSNCLRFARTRSSVAAVEGCVGRRGYGRPAAGGTRP
jgi:hypothetical protein